MSELETVNLLDRRSIPELRDKNFFIPDYQRGYRWGELQIRQLIEDLYNFVYDPNSRGAFYCLQPVVVKQMEQAKVDELGLKSSTDGNVWYEVIDGQQRLTTLRIILALEALQQPLHLRKASSLQFRIYYQTRPKLGRIFDNLDLEINSDDKVTIKYSGSERLDIDTWHILKAAEQILNWFQSDNHDLGEMTGRFKELLTNGRDKDKSVQFIWYELRDDAQPVEIFKRLNDKCVSLNNAELIRGMFLSDAAVYKTDKELLREFAADMQDTVRKREKARKQAHIIEQWDIIERELRNEQFWLFVHNEKNAADAGYSCRIEYIFDLIAKKMPSERDRLFTYVEFDNMLKDGKVSDLWELWLMVETYFSYLKHWYNDNDYYHKIGYLVANKNFGSKILIDLLDSATTNPKKEFNEFIETRIKESIAKEVRRGIPKPILEYTYSDDKEKLKQVLFLYNVETMRLLKKERFPFNKYKSEDNWTLEHIHAQNSDLIDHSDKDKWVEWFDENERVLASLQKRLADNAELNNLLALLRREQQRLDSARDNFQFNDLKLVFDNVLRFFDNLAGAENRPTVEHGISNMALLSGSTNSSISNSVFEVKRQMIAMADASGDFIPICTRNVFMKYYNKNQEDFTVQQNFYWSESDRLNYLADIKRVLGQYIGENKSYQKADESEVKNG